MFRRAVPSAWVLLVLLASAVPAPGQSVAEPARVISGTITFFGCTPSPGEFEVAAVPMIAGAVPRSGEEPGGGEIGVSPPDGRSEAGVVRGTPSATGDARTLSISLPDAEPGTPYRLAIRRTDPSASACGRIFWDGPRQGIVFPGVPTRLVGYAPRASLEVLGTPDGSRDRGWVGADAVDLEDPRRAVRRLRWFTRVAGVTEGLVQVSTERFRPEADLESGCGGGTGLVHEARFAAASDTWNQLPDLNLAAIARAASTRPGGRPVTRLLAYGAPLYVRVVPVTADGARCEIREDGPSPWVIFANALKSGLELPAVPDPGLAPIFLTSQSAYVQPWVSDYPKSGQTLYRTVKAHAIPEDILWNTNQFFADPYGYALAHYGVFHPGDTVPKGSLFWLKPASGGFDAFDVIEAGVSIVTGVVDAVGLLVTEVSKIYDSIKAEVGKVVMSAISATGLVKCEASDLCRQLVEGAINTGLMAAGLPPSLPSWDAIVEQGYDYLAAEIVSQAGLSSVPGAEELTKAAVKELVDQTIAKMDANRGGGGGLPNWLTVDTGLDPPVLILDLATTGDTSHVLFPDTLQISSNAAVLGAKVHLPYQWKKSFLGTFESIKIPIVLRPMLSGFVPPPAWVGEYNTALFAKAYWRTRLEQIPCAFSGLKLGKDLGIVTLPSPLTLPLLGYDPKWSASFNPVFVHCAGQ